ncbi:hypothetical protein Ddc_07591 [Ditylenchus destructor]|nr:hypothetical protein Ddc_07591 [Ditylenchus destructor]
MLFATTFPCLILVHLIRCFIRFQVKARPTFCPTHLTMPTLIFQVFTLPSSITPCPTYLLSHVYVLRVPSADRAPFTLWVHYSVGEPINGRPEMAGFLGWDRAEHNIVRKAMRAAGTLRQLSLSSKTHHLADLIAPSPSATRSKLSPPK